MEKTTRKQNAKETLKILESGFYYNLKGEKVEVADLTAHAITNSIHYKATDGEHLSRAITGQQRKQKDIDKHHPEVQVRNETTLQAIERLLNEDPVASVVCLNFASAKNPGGGFKNGAHAQEESLARATGLYPCLEQMREVYDKNRRSSCCLYTHDMIYSPNVPIFRDDNSGLLLDKPHTTSIITSAAVNAGVVRRREPDNIPKIDGVMLERMERVLSIAITHKHDTIVLGAWGCGCFQNDPTTIARLFQEVLRNKKFKGAFRRVVFSVLDTSKNGRFIKPFMDTFS